MHWPLPSDFNDAFARLTGWPLREEHGGSVPDLYALDPVVVAAVGELSRPNRIPGVKILRFLVPDLRMDFAVEFIDEVAVGGRPQATWRRHAVLCWLDLALVELAILSVSEQRGALEQHDGDGWWRTLPIVGKWASQDSGRPGVLYKNTGYDWESPAGLRGRTVTEFRQIERVEEPEVAMRRSFAATIAYATRPTMDPINSAGSLLDVCQAVKIDPATLSADARIAIEALLREIRDFGPVPQLPESLNYDDTRPMPGFRGPDAWYEHSA